MDQEIINTILKVSESLSHKFIFGFYDAEDIRQEAFMIGMSIIHKWDKSRPLENWLRVSLHNRLINFKRNNYYRKEDQREDETDEQFEKRESRNNAKKFLMDPIDIERVRYDNEDNMINSFDLTGQLESIELKTLIDKYLDVNLRMDYLKMLDDMPIPKNRRDRVEEAIIEIVENHGTE